MKIGILGAGYVGLVTGACLADAGHDVTLVDVDRSRIEGLRRGELPLYEPGLGLVVEGAVERLRFETDPSDLAGCAVVFVAVPTPADAGGRCDLGAVWAAVDGVAPILEDGAAVVLKSTVPPGTTDALQERLGPRLLAACNPEFLREGRSVRDFQTPDRVVVGARSARAHALLARVLASFVDPDRPLIATDPVTAELSKYASNAALAMRVAWINEVAVLAGRVGAEIDAVRQVLGSDPRIGAHYLAPGPGYGGACLPKDVRALASVGRDAGVDLRLIEATHDSNEAHRRWVIDQVRRALGAPLEGRRLAIWGRTFKAHTDDVRHAIGPELERVLAAEGVQVASYDPRARGVDSPARVAADPLTAVEGADALALLTEWPVFSTVSMERVAERMRGRVVVDARNRLDPERVRRAGLEYVSVGFRGSFSP